MNAIKSSLGVSPMLTCYSQKKLPIQYLSQVRLRFDAHFNLIEYGESKTRQLSPGRKPRDISCFHDIPVSLIPINNTMDSNKHGIARIQVQTKY
jgi:hypothetical protein